MEPVHAHHGRPLIGVIPRLRSLRCSRSSALLISAAWSLEVQIPSISRRSGHDMGESGAGRPGDSW